MSHDLFWIASRLLVVLLIVLMIRAIKRDEKE